MDTTSSRPVRDWRYVLKLTAFALFSFVVLGFIGYNAAWVFSMTAPGRFDPCCVTPADFGHDYEEVTFTGGDGLTLHGWWVPSQNGAAVILVHGYGGSRTQMVERADVLAGAGYGVLLYDLRAHGQSEGDFRTFGWADLRDVEGALEWLVSQPGVDEGKIGILGFSIGGQIALRAAAHYPEIRAVIAEEPGFVRTSDLPADPRLSEKFTVFLYWLDLPGIALRTGEPMPPGILDELPAVADRPVLYMTSGPPEDYTHKLVEHFHIHTANSALWNVPETYHGGIPWARPDEYAERVIDFFDRALLNGQDGGI